MTVVNDSSWWILTAILLSLSLLQGVFCPYSSAEIKEASKRITLCIAISIGIVIGHYL